MLIKPDAMGQNIIGKIINIYEANGLIIDDCKMVETDRDILEKHYEEHKEKSFFESLVKSMINQKILALILKGDNAVEKVRTLNGATDPKKAKPGTIRYLYGTNIQQNAVHGSATNADAQREISIWFK